MLDLRRRLAQLLDYDSWADYRTQMAMAGTADRALEFQQQLRDGLDASFSASMDVLAALKAEDTCDVDAELAYWDIPYYVNRLKLREYGVDAGELVNFFSLEQVLAGMMDVFAQLFAIRFTRIEVENGWHDSVRLYVLSDEASAVPLGLLYMDLHPRPGKSGHVGHVAVTTGKRLADGHWQRPVSALLANFPPARADRPSLLALEEVEILFHEFGHVLHALLSTASYARFSGTNVPADFVETPSQLLEYWMRDASVLKRFAVDYRDPDRRIPAQVLEDMSAAREASIALFERRQLAFSLLDMRLHGDAETSQSRTINELAQAVFKQTYLALPDDTAILASFRQLVEYDASYYGYAWSRAIAADLVSLFEHSEQGMMDEQLGWRLREEIFAPGSSRPVEYSIESFLGREYTQQAFFDAIGAAH